MFKIITKKSFSICIAPIFLIYFPLKSLAQINQKIEFISSSVKVIDGNTIILDKLKIRLQGIDAPEMNQNCVLKKNETIEQVCIGYKARNKLIKLINGKKVSCTNEGMDNHKTILSYCYVNGINLNKEMVRKGYAYSYKDYDTFFILDQLLAEYLKRGLWQERFDPPWEYRKLRVKN